MAGHIAVGTATATGEGSGSLESKWIPVVDLRLLSQSELYSLSFSSPTSGDPHRCDDVVIPNIDRSVFNESAGSRKQTYSRLRLASPSSSPSSAASRRRTPHLRPALSPSPSSFSYVNSSDPENAEDAEIVVLIKQLLSSVEMDPGKLVPVKIDYTNLGLAGHKRKRGSPRVNESLGSAFAFGADVVDGFSSLSEIAVREERDGNVINTDGVAVDLAELCSAEHPYSEEMRCRTHGLETEEELLEFLKGLSGQWGSRRKKKKIVDASEFGTALPVGWKLLLSIKKMKGRAWLYCRRYISPCGLHFVSCKEVSSYLLSLQGVQDTTIHNSDQYNEIGTDGDKLTSCAISDTSVHDDGGKDNPTFHVPSPIFGSTSSNHGMRGGVLLEGRGEEILHCNKCNTNFKSEDELLQHESSFHSRKRDKNLLRITDGVIIKDGKYECQICHKIFSERHQYNGHVGSCHVRYRAKTAGELLHEARHPSSIGCSQVLATAMKKSLKSDDARQIHSSVITNHALDMCPPCNEVVGQASEHKPIGNRRAIIESAGLVSVTNTCSLSEVVLSSNESKIFIEDVMVNHNAADNIDDPSSLRVTSGNFSLPLDDRTHSAVNSNMIGDSSFIERPKQSLVGEHSLRDFDINAEKCDVVMNVDPYCQTNDEMEIDCENFVVNVSVFDSFGSNVDQDKDLVISSQQHSSIFTLDTADPKIRTLTMAYEKASVDDNISHLNGKFSTDDTLSLRKCQSENFTGGNDVMSSLSETQHASSAICPCETQENVFGKDDDEAATFLLIGPGPGPQSTSRSTSVVLSVQGDVHDSNYDKDEVCEGNNESRKCENLQNFVDGESTAPFSRSCAGLNSRSVTGSAQDKGIRVCSALISASNEQFPTEVTMTRISNDSSYEHKSELYKGTVPLGESGVLEASNEACVLDKIYATTSSSPSKLSHTETIGKNELSPSNPRGHWNGTGEGAIGISGKDIMDGFENSNSQFGGYVEADSSSAPHLEHVVQGASCPQMPLSSYLNSCDLISDKENYRPFLPSLETLNPSTSTPPDLKIFKLLIGSKRSDFGDGASTGKIFIGGLARDTTLDTFLKYFGKYGEITNSVIMKDRHTGRPRGFGFITYDNPAVVDTVVAKTHVINGKQIEIKRTIPKGSGGDSSDFKTKKIFVGSMSPLLFQKTSSRVFSPSMGRWLNMKLYEIM